MSKLPKTICMLPWVSIETSPIGTMRPCCLAEEEITDSEGKVLSLTQHTLTDAYISPYMQDLRRQFRNGEKPATCKKCWDEEDAGRTSKRMHTQIRLKEMFPKVEWDNDTPQQLWFLDLKLGNICNLKCRICGSWSSSKWAAEELAYLDKDEPKKEHQAYLWLKQGAWPRDNPSFWENMRLILPHVKYIEFTGGEPWLIEEHWELLETFSRAGLAKEVEIHYNTNATQHWNSNHLVIWRGFKRVDIALSIDDIGERFEYQRYGAKWEDTQNIVTGTNFLPATEKNITTQLCFTVNIQNVYYLDELLEWASKEKFGNIYFNMLHGPEHMSVQHMTPAAKEMVLDKLKTTFWKTNYFQKEIDNIIKFIENGPGSDGTEFVAKMKRTDEFRNESFSDAHPEIAKAMGY